MKAIVSHHDFENLSGTFTKVAEIDLSGDPYMSESEALELAYELTQNIEGSWSRGGSNNPDHDPRVTVLAPLPVVNGETYGLRSTMVNDTIEVDGRKFVVASIGFIAARLLPTQS